MKIYNIHEITSDRGKIVFDRSVRFHAGSCRIVGYTDVEPEEYNKVFDLGKYDGSILFVAYINSESEPHLYLGHYE